MNERTIFLEAIEQPTPERREAFLNQACGGDPQLRRKVDELLAAHGDAGSFIEHSPAGERTARLQGSTGDTDDPTTQFRSAASSAAPGVPGDVNLSFLAPSSMPGHLGKLGSHEILEFIGRGAFGIVLRALDPKLNRVVAIKVLAPELAANSMAVRRFLKEAQAAAAVSHDHIVTIHAVDDSTALPYLVMECIIGQSLQQKIDKEGALPVPEILRIGLQIASGLTAAHKQGLVHRDIKPGNILLENGVQRVKITDFGLARSLDDLAVTQTFQVAGTPQYMSPEQAHGETVDQRSDLFSLGSVLYTMCTGRPAFRADSIMGILKRVCDDTPRPIREINPDIPDWLEEIIARLMEKRREDRYQSAAEVAELLRNHLSDVQQHREIASPKLKYVSRPPVEVSSKKNSSWPVVLLVALVAMIALPAMLVPVLVIMAWVTLVPVSPDPPAPFDGPAEVVPPYSVLTVELSDTAMEFRIDDHGPNLTAVSDYQVPVEPGEHFVWFKYHDLQGKTDRFFIAAGERATIQIEATSSRLEVTFNGRPLGVPLPIAPVDLNGVWDSGRGPVTLQHPPIVKDEPVDVTGKYNEGRGSIRGRLAPELRTMLGTFDEGEGARRGSIRLVLSAGGDHIAGTYSFDQPGLKKDDISTYKWDMNRREAVSTTVWHGWPAAAPPPAIAPFDAEEAKRHQEEWAAYLKAPVKYTNSLGMKFRLIPPGEFLMGSTAEELDKLTRELEQAGANDFEKFVARASGPQHPVRITQPFYFAEHEVTIGHYRQFIETARYLPTAEQLGVKKDKWQDFAVEPDADRRAVIGVSWDDAGAFCRWLGKQHGLDYELPTEAQWEYACRAGTTTLWSFGDDVSLLGERAVFGRPSLRPAEVVGTKQPNPFGLYDLHGNAEEWCLDWHDSQFYANSPVDDPAMLKDPKEKNSGRVSRGGTAGSASWWTRSSTRAWDFPATPVNPKGFRPVLSVASVHKALQEAKPADASKPAN